jgi:hypothetical protein
MPIGLNDEAAAYTFIMVVILIIIASIVWAFLMIGLNPVVDVHNDYVATGQVSVQSHYLAVVSIGFLLGVPGITLIGLILAAIVRSIEVSQAGNQY